MERPGPEIRVSALLVLVACVAFNLWLFRLGPLPGLIGLNLTKHVAIAVVCRNAGVNRRGEGHVPAGPAPILDPKLDGMPQAGCQEGA